MKHNTIKRMLPLFFLALGLQTGTAWSKTTPHLPNKGCSLKTLAGSYNWDELTRTDYSKDGYLLFGAGWVARQCWTRNQRW